MHDIDFVSVAEQPHGITDTNHQVLEQLGASCIDYAYYRFTASIY
jgi:hypothetical protein